LKANIPNEQVAVEQLLPAMMVLSPGKTVSPQKAICVNTYLPNNI
jgi:hypothetical protein